MVLKNCAYILAKPLTIMLNISFVTGSIPNEWKLASVVQVHKKDEKGSVENYRPISLSFFISTIVEPGLPHAPNYHFIICNHANPLVNYINLTAKWYISRNSQKSKPLIWDEFVRYTKFAFNGDKSNLCMVLKSRR